MIPQRTATQMSAARSQALRARQMRADLKERLRTGRLALSAALRESDQHKSIAQIRVVDLLRCLPRVGEVRADQLMTEFRIARSRRLGGLGSRQRALLVERFG